MKGFGEITLPLDQLSEIVSSITERCGYLKEIGQMIVQ